MTTASVRQVQHNLSSVLRSVEAGEEVIIRRRNRPVARIVPIAAEPDRKVDWSDLSRWRARTFRHGKLPGKPLSDILSEGRGER